jgi:hypothetical protein
MGQITARTSGVVAATFFLSSAGDAQEAYYHQQRLDSLARSLESCAEIDKLKRQNDPAWAELHAEQSRLESSARYQRDLERAARRRARRGDATRAEVRERTAIEERIARDLGLQPSEIDALTKYATDALFDESGNTSLVRQQVICNRSGSFETPEAYGRAFAEAAAISRSDRGRIVGGLEEVIGTEASEKIVSYALSAAGTTITSVDVEAGLSQMPPAELADMVALFCRAR